MNDRLYLKGNSLLIVFQKYLDYKGIKLFQFINDLLDSLIDKNKKAFIEHIETNNIELTSKLSFIYDSFKKDVALDVMKEMPQFDTLSEEELKKIKKKLSKK